MSRIIERMLENDIDTANDHLPAKKKSLESLTQEDAPSYHTRSGELSRFLVEEIEHLAKDIPRGFHPTFMLPIIMLRRMDLGRGIYTIAGSKTELFFIHRTLSNGTLEWIDLPNWRPIERLARPQVQMIRRMLPSTTCLGFTISIRFDDTS